MHRPYCRSFPQNTLTRQFCPCIAVETVLAKDVVAVFYLRHLRTVSFRSLAVGHSRRSPVGTAGAGGAEGTAAGASACLRQASMRARESKALDTVDSWHKRRPAARNFFSGRRSTVWCTQGQSSSFWQYPRIKQMHFLEYASPVCHLLAEAR